MKTTVIAAVTLAALLLVTGRTTTSAEQPSGGVSSLAAASGTATVVAGAATPSPTSTPITSVPTPSPTVTIEIRPTPPPEPAPPTPGPPTPTPALPEEGGPPGGVLGGHLYVDSDGSRSFTAGDGVARGGAVVDRLEDGLPVAGYGALVDATGFWQVRALPDGVYRVTWDPYLPADQWPLTIPPVETINLIPQDTVHNNTVHVITRMVEIKGANRILDIDFGIPPQPPALGSGGAQFPATGTGSGGTGNAAVLYAVIGGCLALAVGGLVWQRRRRTP